MRPTNLKTYLGISVSLLAVLLILSAGMAQGAGQVQEEWAALYSGPGNSFDSASAIALDASGNVYVTGYSQSGRDHASSDYATIKYDRSGKQIWLRRYNGPGNGHDTASALALDAMGNVYVTGWSDVSVFNSDYATIKYDSTGNQLWVARYNGSWDSDDLAFAVVTDASGNIYVTGQSRGPGAVTIKYDTNGNQLWVARYSNPGVFVFESARYIAVDASGNVYVTGFGFGSGTGFDYATVKYDSSGNQLWVARYRGTLDSYDFPTAMEIDTSGNVYVTGCSKRSGTGHDYATVKYDSSGNQLWASRYNGPENSVDNRATAIAIDISGNVYVTGFSVGSGTDDDYATVKYDSAGNQLWVIRYNGPANKSDVAYAIAVDKSGNVYVTGRSYGSSTSINYATIKYDTNGNLQWVARSSGPANSYDAALAIELDGSCNIYVTGFYAEDLLPDDDRILWDRNYATVKYSQASPQTGDLDCDNDVDLVDLSLYAVHWLEAGCGVCGWADFSGDGDVDLEDFAIFAAQWLAGVEN